MPFVNVTMLSRRGPMPKEKALIVSLIFTVALVSSSWSASVLRIIDTAHLHRLVVDNAYLLEAGREKHAVIIDARTREEYEESHIFSAISIPVKNFENSTGLLPKDKGTLLVVYDSGTQHETGANWAVRAAAAGYANVARYGAGFPAWRNSHMPVAPLGR